jgi:hypothetical protein
MACYDQPLMMAKQIEMWESYSVEVRGNTRFIVVDDAGPKHPFVMPETRLDVQVFRVEQDKAWNQPGARNLGMDAARDGWCLMIDPDMIIPAEVMELVVARVPQITPGGRYRMLLKHMSTGAMDEGCCNIYLIHTDDFWRVGGYDEDYVGHKGFSDVMLHHTLNTIGIMPRWWKDCWADFYSTAHIPDAAVMSLDRGYTHNRSLHLRKIREARRMGARRYLTKERIVLRFPWKQIQ